MMRREPNLCKPRADKSAPIAHRGVSRSAFLNNHSEFSAGCVGTFPAAAMFSTHSNEEEDMKKFGYIIAAIGAIAIAAPSIASAETVVIKRGDRHHSDFRDHRFGARADYREHHDRGWHRGWGHRHDKVVIIKKQRRVY
jgi:hypothetical protein